MACGGSSSGLDTKWGGATVLVTVGSGEQAGLAVEAGADHALNYRAEDVAAGDQSLYSSREGTTAP